MKALKNFTTIVALISLAYYGWRLFGNPNGKKYEFDKKHSVYYKGNGLTETNAKELAENLKDQEYFAGDQEASVQITKTDATKDTVNLKFVVDKARLTPEIENAFLAMGSVVAKKVFSGVPVVVYLADDELDNIKDLGYAKPFGEENNAAIQPPVQTQIQPQTQATSTAPMPSDESVTDPAAQLAPKFKEVMADNKIYYSDAAAGKLDVMTDYLSSDGFFKEGRKLSIVFDKNDQGYFLMLPFSETYLNDQSFLENVRLMGEDIQKKFFPNDQFTMLACDLNMKPVFSYASTVR